MSSATSSARRAFVRSRCGCAVVVLRFRYAVLRLAALLSSAVIPSSPPHPPQPHPTLFLRRVHPIPQIANYLRSVGVKKGDRVVAYLPMVVELPAVMLACARVGAIHSVVFGGFSAEALHQRIDDSRPKVVFTMAGVKRGAKPIPLKSTVDAALAFVARDGVEMPKVVCLDNDGALAREKVPMAAGRDVWWADAIRTQAKSAECEWVDAEDPLFMLYTSGSTGKPKGVVHTTGGFLVGAATTFKYAFDYKAGDVYFSTADCGWITGHTYLTYGPLLNCARMEPLPVPLSAMRPPPLPLRFYSHCSAGLCGFKRDAHNSRRGHAGVCCAAVPPLPLPGCSAAADLPPWSPVSSLSLFSRFPPQAQPRWSSRAFPPSQTPGAAGTSSISTK